MEDIAQKQPNPEYKVAESVIFDSFRPAAAGKQFRRAEAIRAGALWFGFPSISLMLLKFLTLWCRDTAWFRFTVRYTFPTLWNNFAWRTDHVTYRYFVLVRFLFLFWLPRAFCDENFSWLKALGRWLDTFFWLFYAALSVIADLDL